MMLRHPTTETQKRASLLRRMAIVYGCFLVLLLTIVARLIELQVVRGAEYQAAAESQHFGDIRLQAKRGEIFAHNSKTGETNILATNTTLDLLYVDPLVTADPAFVAETLADILVTPEFYDVCSKGTKDCPRELAQLPVFAPLFDPLEKMKYSGCGALLEPLRINAAGAIIPPARPVLPDITEVRRLLSRSIESRISEKRLTFVPLKYGATKLQIQAVQALAIRGVTAEDDQKLVYANPEEVSQSSITSTSRKLAQALEADPDNIAAKLRSRPLRYVPIMQRLPPNLSLKIKEAQLQSLKETLERKKNAATREAAEKIQDPLRSVALIPEHWRFYPDTTIASHVVGFVNVLGDPQYGIERTFNPQLRGQAGYIRTVSDPQGGQILTSEQTIIDPRDGDAVVLSIDRAIQKEVETILDAATKFYKADSGQAIIMDPFTGRIIAMANAPLFDSNDYAGVFEKEPLILPPEKEREIVVEIYHPETNHRVLRALQATVFTQSGRLALTEKTQKTLADLERSYDLHDTARYYLYLAPNIRREIFPTKVPGVWLKYKNDLGVGAYLNRTIQEIYEPGSVMKPITMAIAIDQGEVTPLDMYNDNGPVKVDEYTINNSGLKHYGRVTMINCLEYSINTCMTSIGFKLGNKLFHRMLERFGFGHITGIELEDELPGEVRPWREWSRSLLATTAFGQGLSATPLQMITAFSAIANGGKLMKPTIVDSVIHADGTVEKTEPKIMDQVITKEAADTVTSMLVSAVDRGFAKKAKVPNYWIAGKTGTSQIAGPGGRYETGTGSTVASFMGYAPAHNPKFIMLIKFDRPKNVQHGADSAAPVFKEIAEFLFRYYDLPPER
jgi:cell division protein FtsI/penicillin-binding protein 2